MDIKTLYEKVSEFEGNIRPSLRDQSSCQKGCSRCCYTDLSVFEVEASSIRTWFGSLPEGTKKNLRELWKNPLRKATDFQGREVSSCAFLANEACTIYEARPLICRTQGLALKFRQQGETVFDICPLNEELLPILTEKESLNLDLLNTILSQLEKLDSGDVLRERVSLSQLRNDLWTE